VLVESQVNVWSALVDQLTVDADLFSCPRSPDEPGGLRHGGVTAAPGALRARTSLTGRITVKGGTLKTKAAGPRAPGATARLLSQPRRSPGRPAYEGYHGASDEIRLRAGKRIRSGAGM